VSVFAAFQGQPSLALGNAVGSIICDTGLILGLATVISPPPLVRRIVNRQGWIQLGAAVLLVVACVPWMDPRSLLENGGLLPRFMGFVFLALLVGYMWISVLWSREDRGENEPQLPKEKEGLGGFGILCKLLAGVFLVVGSSRLLIPSVEEVALRWHVPDSIIGATLVAFGTSLPELVTALTAVRRGHGEIAVGNVIGADILNVLFVAGASAAVTSPGLHAPAFFFKMQFPAMIALLLIFRFGVMLSKDRLRKGVGWMLLAGYLVVTILSYR
jgi:cation:H+ antiporter